MRQPFISALRIFPWSKTPEPTTNSLSALFRRLQALLFLWTMALPSQERGYRIQCVFAAPLLKLQSLLSSTNASASFQHRPAYLLPICTTMLDHHLFSFITARISICTTSSAIHYRYYHFLPSYPPSPLRGGCRCSNHLLNAPTLLVRYRYSRPALDPLSLSMSAPRRAVRPPALGLDITSQSWCRE
ncbi:hypothetical protein GALMADRAFT_1125157 [Galerina marginata CBS 339.88]|uniref:Uncharacterized protein n=1 Tax=Galerina marginata (strain CBS 339.88) TaxID=685588 RepID=A0A067TMZ8_GALM3|nr:hypothetical protein GALMADRAFT_1125157 [Galerina marginata CBS 339.88]